MAKLGAQVDRQQMADTGNCVDCLEAVNQGCLSAPLGPLKGTPALAPLDYYAGVRDGRSSVARLIF